MTIDRRLGGDEIPIGPGNLEFAQWFFVTGFQPTARVGKAEPDCTSLDLHRFVEGAGVDDAFLAVRLGQGPESQSLSHVQLVTGVDVPDVVDQVGGHHHAGAGDLEALDLGFPECR